MRSEAVHRALERVNNRYLLCHATAKTTRYLVLLSHNPTDAISDALTTLSYTQWSTPMLQPLPPTLDDLDSTVLPHKHS